MIPFLSSFGAKERSSITDSVDRQLGEITATLTAVREDIAELKAGQAGLAKAQSASTGERRSQQQIVISRITAIENTTTSQHASNTAILATLKKDVADMKVPVGQFVSMRNKMGAMFIFAGTTIGLIWTLAEPVYNFVVIKIIGPLTTNH